MSIIRCCYSQSVKIGVLAGVNQSAFFPQGNSAYDFELDLKQASSPSITGFHVGVFTEFTNGNFSFEPGLIYESIEGKANYNEGDGRFGSDNGAYQFNVQYFQLPLNGLINIPVSFGKVFFGGGPYIGLGGSGKTHQTGVSSTYNFPYTSIINTDSTTPYRFGSADRFDFGLNALAGIRFKNKFLFTLGYGAGLRYVFNQQLKNNVASVSLGYAFY